MSSTTTAATRPASEVSLDPSALSASIWLWHVPSASFTVVCALVVTAGRSAGDVARAGTVGTEVVGIGVVVLASLLASWVARGPGRDRQQAAVPVLLLVAAALVHGASAGAMSSTILVTGLPLAWLAFTYGLPGTMGGIAGVLAVGVAPFVAGGAWPTTRSDRLDVLLPLAALAGMACVTYGASRLLTAARCELLARDEQRQRETATTNTVLEAVDAAYVILAAGAEPVGNDKAHEMFRRGGVVATPSADGPLVAGDQVFGPDRVSVVHAEEQAPLRALRGEQFDGVLQWWGPSGDQVAMVCSAHPIEGADGVGHGIVFVAWDATELLESMRVREEFLATVSHELRTPLTSIIGYLEMHREAVSVHVADEVAERCLEVVRRNAVVLKERIEQLLTMSDHDGPSSVAPVDVAALTRAKVAEHRVDAARAGLELSLSAPPHLWARVNSTDIGRVLDNVVGNAVKYTRDGSVTVSLTTAPSEGVDSSPDAPAGFELRVEDTGVGMDETVRRYAFDRFYRSETAVRGAVPGLGIGLAITQQLVASHQGSVSIDSNPGVGTTLVVTVPALPVEDADPALSGARD